ncbi:hypothetical protein FF1_009722 [Malus domestica]|uniref:uncharacterized protein LOC126592824 n=1 Tax=Malus sylvestris TaxID=3752 RepID=UPI0021AC9CC4|nr:uncharacterized protein LOC126592824 [Malus sylvestris]
MCSTREKLETFHNPIKLSLILPNIKPKHVNFIIPLILCSIVSISLILYFYFSVPHKIEGNYSVHRKPLFTDEEKTNITHILFGIGGSVNSWKDRQHYSELWWKPNVTRGYVWLDQKPDPNMTWSETLPPYRVSEDTSRFKYSCLNGPRSAVRIARIVKESFELGLEKVRWFVLGDDDTVYFTENLVAVLARYDHNQMYYIGGISESVEQNVGHSYNMAYGGGGFAISYPLASELVKILDGCINRYDQFYGSDIRIQACLSEIGVPLTKEPGFHQFDIRGSPLGLLAAHPLAPLVSLHHLDYVQSIFPNHTRVDSVKKLIRVSKIDPGRTLQHNFGYDLRRNWSISVSWGYTVQLYPKLVAAKMLETALQTFQTWSSSMGPFTFDTRSIMLQPCERPIMYLLDQVERVGEDETVTTYKRYKSGVEINCVNCDCRPALEIEFFKVSAPKLNPKLWDKAPRRQCVEVINGTEGVDNVIKLQIRGCNRFESVTPP